MRLLDSMKVLAVGISLCVLTLGVSGAPAKSVLAVKDVAFMTTGPSLEVRIIATHDADFTYFELNEPHRLVVDFHGTRNDVRFAQRKVGASGVERVRTSLFNYGDRKATRIVFDLANDARYQVIDEGSLIRVVFNPAGAVHDRASNDVAKPSGRAPLNLVAGPPTVPALPEETSPRAPKLADPEPKLAPTASALAAALPSVKAPGQITTAPPQTGAPITAPPQPQQYSGEIISLDLRDVDLKDFFRLIGEISGLNIVLDPNVGGSLTLRLTDVPWDQALDVVLRNFQLGGQLQGNVLRIATNSTLQAEENARKQLRDAQELAADLSSKSYILNYTKADAVSATLRTFLTSRGTITQDPRKNALIVSDVPGQFGKIDDLIKFLDTPQQQVEIEARLLSANKSFTRDIGNQLGFVVGNNSGNVLTGGAGTSSPFIRNPPPRVTTGQASVPLAVDLPAAATSGLAFLLQPGGDIILDEIITLAETRGTAKLISRPKVTTQNNQPATISQGTQIPVQTNVNNTISVQFIEFALKLTVTPQITSAGTILLNARIENSTPDFARSVNNVPSVATQQAQTQVLMPDGATAMVGGILVDSDSVNVRQVPGLGSIPIIGYLFKNTLTVKSTSELLFFITAKIKPAETLDVTAPGD